MFSISDESDTSEELGDADQPEASRTAEPSHSGLRPLVSEILRGESVSSYILWDVLAPIIPSVSRLRIHKAGMFPNEKKQMNYF